jgi:hypothetical protein
MCLALGNLAVFQFLNHYSWIPSTVIMLTSQVKKETRYNAPLWESSAESRALIFGEQPNFWLDHL